MQESAEQFIVYGWAELPEGGLYMTVWDGTAEECKEYTESPQARLDLEMGVFYEYLTLPADSEVNQLVDTHPFDNLTTH